MAELTTNSDMFSLQLSETPDGTGYKVNSVEIVQPNFLHRLTFSRNNLIHEVLSFDLSSYVLKLLDQINQDTMVFSEPDAVVELPGLVLGKLRMLVHRSQKKQRSVIVRFAYFIGGVQAAFRVDTHFQTPSVQHREAVAVSALMDICIPAFDIISSQLPKLPEEQKSEAVSDRLSALSHLESDLTFYLCMLQRYVVSAANDALPAPRPKKILPIRNEPQRITGTGGPSGLA